MVDLTGFRLADIGDICRGTRDKKTSRLCAGNPRGRGKNTNSGSNSSVIDL